VKLRKRRADSNLVDVGRYAVHARCEREAGDSEAGKYRPVGRPRGRSAAYSWRGGRGIAGHLTRRSVGGERGKHPQPPSLLSILDSGGQVRCRLWADGCGGAVVVLRAGESPEHGEGRQQAGSKDAGMFGGRR